jgi:hypothetical protein
MRFVAIGKPMVARKSHIDALGPEQRRSVSRSASAFREGMKHPVPPWSAAQGSGPTSPRAGSHESRDVAGEIPSAPRAGARPPRARGRRPEARRNRLSALKHRVERLDQAASSPRMPLPGRVDLHLSPGHHQAPDRRSESRSDVQAIAPAASAWIVRRPAFAAGAPKALVLCCCERIPQMSQIERQVRHCLLGKACSTPSAR